MLRRSTRDGRDLLEALVLHVNSPEVTISTTLPTMGIRTSMRWFCDSWALVSGVTPISRATCCPEGRPIFLPRRRFRTESRLRGLDVGQRRRGQLEQRAGQRGVELAHGPSGGRTASLKNLLHWIFSRGGSGRDPFKLLSSARPRTAARSRRPRGAGRCRRQSRTV